ncbi:hypothetical protein VTH06DRAFT_6280 [Thermothelomyces fergusii]
MGPFHENGSSRLELPTSDGEFAAPDPDLSSPGILLVEPPFRQNNLVSNIATSTTPSRSATPIPTQSPATARGARRRKRREEPGPGSEEEGVEDERGGLVIRLDEAEKIIDNKV